MTKVDGIRIEEFADGEYRGDLERDDINGQSFLLYGGSRTGKTLTFNAILYCLLGADETVNLSTGRSNRVSLEFDDDTEFLRGQPHAEHRGPEESLTGSEAKNKLSEKIGDEELIKLHFLHSHIQYLPLNELSGEDRIQIIRRVTNRELEERVRTYRKAEEQLDGLVQETQDKKRRLENRSNELDRQISAVESQVEKDEELMEFIESGVVEEIRDKLLENRELEEELENLFKRKEGIRQELRKKHRQKRKQENLADEVRTVIAESVNDFVCPTCDRRVSSEKAENRIEQNTCPYCGRDHSLTDLKDRIRSRIDNSDEILEELRNEIEELEEEKEEIESKIESIQEDRPELSNLDSRTSRKLRINEYHIEELRNEVSEDLEDNKEKLNDLQEEKEELDTELDEIDEKLEVYSDSFDHSSNKAEELEQESFETGIEEFTNTWEEIYQEMSTSIGLQINMTDEGEIELPGHNNVREYGDGNLSSSEMRLLNLSFVYTLNMFAEDADLISWGTFVLDEAVDNMDEESRTEVLEFMQESESQFILTSSNVDLTDRFDLVEELSRESIQSTLADFANGDQT